MLRSVPARVIPSSKLRQTARAIRFLCLAHGYQQTITVVTAHRLGLFKKLAAGPRTASQLADELGLNQHNLEVLLEALEELDCVEQRAGQFVNGELAREQLVPGGAFSMTSFLDVIVDQWSYWKDLEEVIRSGEGHPKLSVYSEECEIYPNYIRACLQLLEPPSQLFVRQVELGHLRRILVGTVGTTFAKAVKQAQPQVVITVACLPHFIAQLDAMRAEFDLPQFVETVETDPDPDNSQWGSQETYDLIFFARKFAFVDEQHGIAYLRKAREVLRPGGMVVLWEPARDNFHGFSWFRTTVALEDVLMGHGTSLYSLQQLRQFVSQAGFDRVRTVDVMSGTISFTIGYQS